MDRHNNKILIEALTRVAIAIVTKRYREENDRKEWALVSKEPDKRTGKRRVLKWFGTEKPTKEEVAKEERRVQYFKHQG